MGNPLLGIGLMLLSTTSMNIGSIIQKKAVDSLPPMEEKSVGENVKGVVGSKIWIFGWILTTTAMVLNMVALGQADLTVLQPLIGFGLIVLVIFSRIILKEKITRYEMTGIGVAIVGVALIGLAAEQSREFTTVIAITSSYTQVKAIIILVIFLAVILGLWISTIKMKYKGAGIIFATIAALFSVIGLTFSKGLFSILELIGFVPTLKLWQAWVLLISFVGCSTMAIAVQQMSFQKGKAVVVTPVFNLGSIIFPLATGAMVFSEDITPVKIIATIIIFIGAILLSIKKPEINAENQDKIIQSDTITDSELKVEPEL